MSALPPDDRGGPGCRCHECQGIHCMLPHHGHSHRDWQPDLIDEAFIALLDKAQQQHDGVVEGEVLEETVAVPPAAPFTQIEVSIPHRHRMTRYHASSREYSCECGYRVSEAEVMNIPPRPRRP